MATLPAEPMVAPTAAAGAISSLSKSNPFPGLRPYEEADANWFFGRGGEINDLLKRLRFVHFVAIVGASGCGKSSLIRAGVLPQIRDGYLDSEWTIAAFRPGERPIENLAETLGDEIGSMPAEMIPILHSGSLGLVKAIRASDPRQSRNVLILVDQFEELFQFAHRGGDTAQEEVKEFLKLLLTAAASDEVAVYVVITMRLEWLNECATYVGMAEAINEGIYLVPQMTRRQFNQAILGPLDAANGLMTSGLLDRMLNDLDGRSDQLPVLQHALLRLWERREGTSPFDQREYEAVGTFSNCLSAHAEEVFAELTAPQKRVAELLFRCITQVYKGRKIRRPRPVEEIAAATGTQIEQLEPVISAFSRTGRSFLVTTEGQLGRHSIVDISHEALIRQWERLCGWVDDEAETQSRLERLEVDAAEWDRDRKAFRSSLYRGRQLRRAEELMRKLDPSSASSAFLKAAQRGRLLATVQIAGLCLFIVVMLGSVIAREIYDARARQRDTLALAEKQKDVAQREAALANDQVKKAKEFQDSVVQQIHDAKGSATALAAIAQNIQAQRVYLQYIRGSSLDQPKSVQSLLQKQGYSVPPLQAVAPDRAPDRTQVRFFHGEDQAGATKIANLLGPLLATNLAVQATANPNNVVPVGQFEVWLASPSFSPQQQNVVKTVSDAVAVMQAVTTGGTTDKKDERAVAANAAPMPPVIAELNTSSASIQQGQTVTLSWQTSAATTIEITGVGPVQAGGSTQLTPQQTTEYTLTASGPGGSTMKQVRVEVTPTPVAVTATPVNAEPPAIKAAINRYKEAYESESLDEMKKAWPSISKARQKDLKTSFDFFNAIRLTLSCRDEDIHVDGPSASAACHQSAVYTTKGKKQPEMTTQTVFRLKKQDGVWVVDSVQ